jgi:Photosynthesis system II assembly factor YCF48
MPLDDRDRNLEKALARNLQVPDRHAPDRAGAPAATPTSRSAAQSESAITCPDAEVLAAYHERLLTPEEMIVQKEHLAGCVRCQEILAHLEATDEIELEADRVELKPAALAAAPLMRAGHIARTEAIPVADRPPALSRVAVEMRPASANWRWLVPTGALAAALMIWVAVRESNPPPFQLARNQGAPLSAPAQPLPQKPTAVQNSTAPDLQSSHPTDSYAAGDTAGSTRKEGAALDQKMPPTPAPRKGLPLPKLSTGADTRSAGLARERLGPAVARMAQQPKEKPPAERSAAPAPPVSSVPTATDSAANIVATVPSAPQDEIQARALPATSGVAGAPAQAQLQTNRIGVLALRQVADAQARNRVSVSSPDGTVTWRLAPAGIIERSSGASGNWTLQETGVVTDLLAGSSVSDKVCWVAGRSGTLLRTTDGGRHWRTLSAPTSEDIASIFAIDDNQATITTISNQSYKTTDGGQTWTPQPIP